MKTKVRRLVIVLVVVALSLFLIVTCSHHLANA